MKNSFYVVAFVLAVALAYAASQTSPQQQPNPGYSQPSMPDTHDMGVPQDQPAPPNSAASSKDADNHSHAAVDDSDIQKQVLQQMASQNFNAVGVNVEKGVVTLSGAVASKEDRKRARELAKSVAGVKSVREKLNVDAAAASALPVNSQAAPGSSPGGAASVGSTESQQNTAGSIAGNASAAGATQAGSAPPAAGAQQSGTTGGVTGQATGTTGASTGTTGQATGVTGPATGTTGQSTGVTGTSTGISGSATGATGSATGATGTATSEEGGDLQGRIDNAIKAEPTLTGSNVVVNVTGDTIELSGSVPTGKEKQTADRIASSFAGNHKVVDRITVTGRGNAVSPTSNPQGTTPQGADQDQNKNQNQNQQQPPTTPKR